MRLGLRNLIRKERFRKEKIPTRTETRISGKHLRSERQADSECSPPPTLHRIPGRYLGHPEIPGIGTKIRQSGFGCTCVFPHVILCLLKKAKYLVMRPLVYYNRGLKKYNFRVKKIGEDIQHEC